MPPISRRDLVLGGAAIAGAILMPVARSVGSDGEVRHHIAIKKASQILFEDVASPLWTFGGTTPGPEIRVRRGERVRAMFSNELDEPTSVHWHGIRLENAMDGVPGLTQDLIEPGESFTYDFVAPDAGTYWYHAHNRSWNQVARGLYAPLIIDELDQPFPPERDLTLVLDDWRLNEDGVLDEESLGSLMDWSHAGRLGNWLTVNGFSRPTYNLEKSQPYRLRLINASNARILQIDPKSFAADVIALDGQAFPDPISMPSVPLPLGPAQRVDLLVTPSEPFDIQEISGQNAFSFITFKVEPSASPPAAAPSLVPNDIPEPDIATGSLHSLVMAGGAMGGRAPIRHKGKVLDREEIIETGQFWTMNGHANLTDKPLFRAERGETILLETENLTRFAHAMHLHGHHFRVIEHGNQTFGDDQFWRDTFIIGPQQKTKIAFVADNPGKWLLHCHMLEHAAAGMNTWFEVIG